jgi:pentatricopeptide repeat protein
MFLSTSFKAARALCGQNHLLRMELLSRMLHALASYCNFDAASSVFNELYSAGKDELLSTYQFYLPYRIQYRYDGTVF